MQEMQSASFASSEWKGVVGVNRSITSTHAQQSTALKSHSCFELV